MYNNFDLIGDNFLPIAVTIIISLGPCYINNCFCLGARQSGSNHGLVAQRQLDGNGGPRGLREVLAVEHEQCEDVPGAQRGSTWNKVSTTCLRIYNFNSCIYNLVCDYYYNKWHLPEFLIHTFVMRKERKGIFHHCFVY